MSGLKWGCGGQCLGGVVYVLVEQGVRSCMSRQSEDVPKDGLMGILTVLLSTAIIYSPLILHP
jgi:hypothetical protein